MSWMMPRRQLMPLILTKPFFLTLLSLGKIFQLDLLLERKIMWSSTLIPTQPIPERGKDSWLNRKGVTFDFSYDISSLPAQGTKKAPLKQSLPSLLSSACLAALPVLSNKTPNAASLSSTPVFLASPLSSIFLRCSVSKWIRECLPQCYSIRIPFSGCECSQRALLFPSSAFLSAAAVGSWFFSCGRVRVGGNRIVTCPYALQRGTEVWSKRTFQDVIEGS